MPGNRRSRWWAITSSSGTKRSVFGTCTQRGRTCGALTRAKRGAASPGALIETASDRLTFEMKGNGWAGSTASGVSTGKNWRSNSPARWRRSLPRSSSQLTTSRPCWARAGRRSELSSRRWRFTIGRTLALIAASCCKGVPSVPGSSSRTLLASCCFRPPTRFMKNSSRLESKMAMNFSRSSSGLAGVLRLVQHAGVELQPRQLAVQQIGGFDDLFDRFHTGWVGLGHGALDLRRLKKQFFRPAIGIEILSYPRKTRRDRRVTSRPARSLRRRDPAVTAPPYRALYAWLPT